MPIFPVSLYRKLLTDPETGNMNDVLPHVAGHLITDLAQDDYSYLPDQPKDEDYSYLPDQPTESPSMIGGALNKFFNYKPLHDPIADLTPLTDIGASAFRKASPEFSQMMLDAAPFGIGDIIKKYHQSRGESYDPRETVAGGIDKAGEFATSMTSPYNLGLIALSEGTSIPAELGLRYAPTIAKGMRLALRAGTAPIAAQGIREDYNLATGEEPFTWGKAAGAAANTVFGGLGMLSGETPKLRNVPEGAPPPPPPPSVPPTKPYISAAEFIRRRDAANQGINLGPTPTMADMAPRTAAPAESDIPGVVFQGDHAVLTVPSEANMAALEQRGYGRTGKLQNGWPVWHKKENLSDTPFSRAMRASIARDNPSQPIPQGMDTSGARPISPTEPITLPKALASQDKLSELAEQGYEIHKVLPNGDVVLQPTGSERGTTAFSDPFGVASIGKLAGKGVELAKDALGRVTENRLEGLNKLRDDLLWMGGHFTREHRQWMRENVFKLPYEPYPGEIPLKGEPDYFPVSKVERNNAEFQDHPPLPPVHEREPLPYGVGAPGELKDLLEQVAASKARGETFTSSIPNRPPVDIHSLPSPMEKPEGFFGGTYEEEVPGFASATPGEIPHPQELNITPSKGSNVLSDPFGIGVIGRGIQGLREHFSPAGGGRGGGATIGERLRIAASPAVDHAHNLQLEHIRTIRDIPTLEDYMDENSRLAVSARASGDDAAAAQFEELANLATSRRNIMRSFTARPAPQVPLTPEELAGHQDRINTMTVNNFGAVGDALTREFHDGQMNAIARGNRTLASQYRVLYEHAQEMRDTMWEQARNIPGYRHPTDRPLRALDTNAELNKVRGLTDTYDVENAAKDYSGMHETALAQGDTEAANNLEMLYKESAKKYKELTSSGKGRGERPAQDIMDEYMHNPANGKTAKEIARYERKKNRPMSGVAKQLQGVEGISDLASNVQEGDFNRGINHSYARTQLARIPGGNPGIEFIARKPVKALADEGQYRVVYRNSDGKPIVKADFRSQFGVGKIDSFVYDQSAGLSGRALLKVIKEMTPYGVKMPGGMFSPFTANLMSNLGRMVNTAHGGFIDLGSLFSKDPDSNPALVDYIKTFFSKKNTKGQTIADIPKLAENLKNPGMLAKVGNYIKGTPPRDVEGKLIEKPSVAREAYNATRGGTTTMDLSAPLRQGLPLMFTKAYREALLPMFKALGSEEAFQKQLDDLRARPLFQRQWDATKGKLTHSFSEIADMKLSDLHTKLNGREEAIASNWIENGAFLGEDLPWMNRKTGAQEFYQKTIGRAARASNRAYTAFLNQLRADSFESMMKDAYRDFKSGTKGAKNPYTDLTYAKEIAAAVNTLTGRGPLKFATPGIVGGRLGEGGTLGLKERSIEQLLPVLSDVIFSPRLMASRVRMLNPGTYMMASPFVRKQYLKGLISVVGFAGTLGALAKGAGADVSLDSNSSDFMKIKMGNTRLDMMGGFQQYAVAVSRLLSGHYTSSATGKDFEMGQGYRSPTAGSSEQNFMANKLHPVVKFGYDLAYASQHQPFQVGDRTLQLFVPLIVGDVLELAKEDPKLLPAVVPILFGAGSQTYDKGSPGSKFLPSQYDLNMTSASQAFPWNWGGINKQ